MAAPLRVYRRREVITATQSRGEDGYLGRLVKMIPSEVVAAYLAGAGVLADSEPSWLLAWAILCLLLVVAFRVMMTRDLSLGQRPQWMNVALAVVAYLIWLYNLGGPFQAYGYHEPKIGSLLLIAWTAIVPLFYHGD